MSSSFSATPAELTLVSQIFAQADPQKLGVVTGDAAVKVFNGAKLNPNVLGEIWNIADEDNKGWLSKRGVTIAVRLIGWAQKGEKINTALLLKPGPLPKLESVNVVSQHHTGISLPKSPPAAFLPLSFQDKAKFQGIFLKAGPLNGLLSGEKARDIFVKSKLSNDVLLQIWNLADTQDRGALDSTDFAIGMYFIQGLMSGKIAFIPNVLPPGIYQQAGGGSSFSSASVISHTSGNSGSFSPVSSTFQVQQQYTGQASVLQSNHTGMSNQSRAPSLPARPAFSSPFSPPIQVLPWDVTQADKATSDQYFDNLDSQNKGYIEGDVAVPFMLESKLPGEVLAQVWDLADINNDGRLTRDGFAVAMFLIQKKLAGIEVPPSLPPTLIPPSMRSAASSAFSMPSNSTHHSEPAKDLFSFDDTPPSSAIASQPSGGIVSLQSGSMAPSLPQSTSRSLALDPFGTSVSTYTSVHHDLLGDDDLAESASPPLPDQSAEIGNLKNQLSSTNQSLDTSKAERSTIEQTLTSQASQLSALQTQLSSAKAAYDTEAKLLATLKERHATQVSEMQKAREELIRAESDLSAVKVEKAEIEGSFLRDKEDARDLHKRMIEVGKLADAVKAEVEKLKKEAKQQKGLLAIARKQLSSKETEKAKTAKELEEAHAELNLFTKGKEQAEAELTKIVTPVPVASERTIEADAAMFAASHPLPVSPDPASPIVVKSNNPFERLAMSGGSTPQVQSPFLAFQSPSSPALPVVDADIKDTYDDIFGLNHRDTKKNETERTEGLSYGHDVPSEDTAPLSINDTTSTSESMSSPVTGDESEIFATPPTSARNITSVSSDGPARFPAIDDVASQFPVIGNGALLANGHHHLDEALGSQIKENVVESDSDDDEEVPLAELAQGKQGAALTPINETQTIVDSAESTLKNTETFDDIFGAPAPIVIQSTTTSFSPPIASRAEPQPNTGTIPFATPTSPAPYPNIQPAQVIGGVDAFDEALGKISTSTSTPAPHFSFDTVFEDNFDFDAVSSEFLSVVPNGDQIEPQTSLQTSNFDSILSSSNVNGEPTVIRSKVEHQDNPTEILKPDTANLSFDEVFSGTQPSSAPSLESDSAIISTRQKSSIQISEPSIPGSFPTSSSPISSKLATSRVSGIRPVSPAPMPRSPPRVGSPKPRISSSSSKEIPEKAKEPTARHSKLSIRLPFGRKKKHQEPMPPPSHLVPPLEQPDRAVTPAIDDDVEPVKQLTAMGFSRTQAIVALEKYDYDVQKALNNLLGGQ